MDILKIIFCSFFLFATIAKSNANEIVTEGKLYGWWNYNVELQKNQLVQFKVLFNEHHVTAGTTQHEVEFKTKKYDEKLTIHCMFLGKFSFSENTLELTHKIEQSHCVAKNDNLPELLLTIYSNKLNDDNLLKSTTKYQLTSVSDDKIHLKVVGDKREFTMFRYNPN